MELRVVGSHWFNPVGSTRCLGSRTLSKYRLICLRKIESGTSNWYEWKTPLNNAVRTLFAWWRLLPRSLFAKNTNVEWFWTFHPIILIMICMDFKHDKLASNMLWKNTFSKSLSSLIYIHFSLVLNRGYHILLT